MDKLTLLFICTGNLCRSVMAEGFLRAMQADRGTELVTLDSAGVNAVGGQPPPRDVIDVMADRGIDVSGYRAQALSLEQIVETDLLLTMALHQSRRVLIQAHMMGWKVFTLKEFVLCAEGMNGDGHHINGDLQSYLGKFRGLEGMKYLMKGKTLPDLLEQHEFANHDFVQHFFRLQHHIYSEDLTIDDPMGQSRAFMDRTADEIQEYVERLYPCLEHIVEYR